MNKCVICGKKVDWDYIKDEFAEILQQADCLGVDSLTEAQQIVYERKCCSDCYFELD
jgi:hypothetical protein